MLERNKMQMLSPAAIDNVAFHLYPGVRLETISFFPRPDSDCCIQAPAPEHPAENERLFQATGSKKKIHGGDSFEVRDSPRDVQRICFESLRIPRRGASILKNCPANPETKQAHRKPRNEQTRRSFEHNSALKSAQTAKPAPPPHHRLNP